MMLRSANQQFLRSAPWTRGTVAQYFLGGSSRISNLIPFGRGPHLTTIGNPVHAPEAPGTSIRFVTASTQAALEPGLDSALKCPGEVTLSCLWRPGGDYTTSQALMANMNSAANNADYHLVFAATDNKITFGHTDGTTLLTSALSISSDVWRRLVLTRRGSAGAWTLTLFIDGAKDVVVSTATNPLAGASHGFAIGRYGAFASSYITGAVADARVWNRGLTDGEAIAYSADPYYEFLHELNWFSDVVVAGGFQAAWASQRSRVIGAGVH